MKLRSHRRRCISSETPWFLRYSRKSSSVLKLPAFIQLRSIGLLELVGGFFLELVEVLLADLFQLGEGVLEDDLALDELVERLVPDFGAALGAFRLRQVAGGHQAGVGGGEDFLVEDDLVVDGGADAGGRLADDEIGRRRRRQRRRLRRLERFAFRLLRAA